MIGFLTGSLPWAATSLAVLTFSAGFTVVNAQRGPPPGSAPKDYPGKPSGPFSPEWQNYYQVTAQLPNVTFDLGRNWAGNIPVDRENHPNNTLFFWGFEKENGSLTANAGERSSEPWGIWLNGGPGSSSMVGLLFENGPIHIRDDYSVFSNNFSWNHLADYFWVDQPVGTGFSTADEAGFVPDEDQMGRDFFGFLTNLVEVFPSLKTRPLYITGESYAGTYIPYIMKTYFGLSNPPVKVAKFAIGDGSIGTFTEFELLPALSVIETYPQLIGYDPQVYEYFKTQTHLCGFDLNITYPQNGKFPNLEPPLPQGFATASRRILTKQALLAEAKARVAINQKREAVEEKRARWVQEKRDLSGRANGTIDSWYQCDLLDEMIDYALNFSLPWSIDGTFQGYDVYNVPDALSPEAPMDGSIFLNNPSIRAAIHAPDKTWQESIFYPFAGLGGQDPSDAPMAFLDQLAANASAHGVGVVMYSGNDDSLVAHRSTELVIQNTTFGGIQGFSRKPQTPWFDDSGEFAGIVHQERNWTFVLFHGAGHLVPQQQPAHAMVFLREFVLGSNRTGFFDNTTNSVTGGEDVTVFANNIMAGQTSIFVGAGKTESAMVYPSATIEAWASFTQTGVAPGPSAGSGGSNPLSGGSGSGSSGAGRMATVASSLLGLALMIVAAIVL